MGVLEGGHASLRTRAPATRHAKVVGQAGGREPAMKIERMKQFVFIPCRHDIELPSLLFLLLLTLMLMSTSLRTAPLAFGFGFGSRRLRPAIIFAARGSRQQSGQAERQERRRRCKSTKLDKRPADNKINAAAGLSCARRIRGCGFFGLDSRRRRIRSIGRGSGAPSAMPASKRDTCPTRTLASAPGPPLTEGRHRHQAGQLVSARAGTQPEKEASCRVCAGCAGHKSLYLSSCRWCVCV
jgi:hypothetical protein